MERRFGPHHEYRQRQYRCDGRQEVEALFAPGKTNQHRLRRHEEGQRKRCMLRCGDEHRQQQDFGEKSGEADHQVRAEPGRLAQVARFGPKYTKSRQSKHGDQANGMRKKANRKCINQLEGTVEPEQCPNRGARNRCIAQPPPDAAAQRGKARNQNDEKIGEQSPGARRCRRNDCGCAIGPDEAQSGDEGALQARQGERPDGNDGKANKGRARSNQIIERVGGIDAAEQRDDAAGGQGRRNIALLLA